MSPTWTLPGVPHPPDWRVHWDDLHGRNPALAPLGDCPQDPIWHPEGDVLRHTRLVVEALAALPAWRDLPAEPRSLLFTAALLHDIAKPDTTRPDDEGRLIAPGHGSRGARRARSLLYRAQDLDLPPPPLHLREQIVALVRHHGLPLWWLDRDRPDHAAIQATQRVPGAWLALLSEADAQGRGSADRSDLRDRLAGFRDLCREAGCYDAPRAFATPGTRRAYLADGWLDPDTPPYDRSRFEVLVMAGLPGAGKDTWLARHAPTLPQVSLDAERARLGIDPAGNQGAVIQAAREAARVHLRAGEPFAWNATNVTREVRGAVLQLLCDYRARARVVYLEAPYADLQRRNRERDTPVPRAVLERLIDRLEPPGFDEADEVEWLEHDALPRAAPPALG